MTYAEWFQKHGGAVNKIIARLRSEGQTDEEIVNYFTFENMREAEPSFCPLYAMNKKCHDIVNLNCMLCGCPYFRCSDDGIRTRVDQVVYSTCIKGLGEEFGSEGAVHQDCTSCIVPHSPRFALRQLKKHGDDWFAIMRDVII